MRDIELMHVRTHIQCGLVDSWTFQYFTPYNSDPNLQILANWPIYGAQRAPGGEFWNPAFSRIRDVWCKCIEGNFAGREVSQTFNTTTTAFVATPMPPMCSAVWRLTGVLDGRRQYRNLYIFRPGTLTIAANLEYDISAWAAAKNASMTAAERIAMPAFPGPGVRIAKNVIYSQKTGNWVIADDAEMRPYLSSHRGRRRYRP